MSDHNLAPHPEPTKIVIFINKKRYDAARPAMTGREIKALAGYGDDYELRLIQGEGDREGRVIGDDEPLEMKNGLHFRALPKNRNFGRAHPDIERCAERLRALGYTMDVKTEGTWVGVIFNGFPVRGPNFNTTTTRLLIRLPNDPNAAIDMFWTSVELKLKNGSDPQSASSIEHYFGEKWRRFSWHPHGQWKPGRDDLVTYVDFVEDRLAMGV